MKSSDHDPILKEILADESLEAVRWKSLEQGLAIARGRKQRVRWAKAGFVVAALGAALWLLVPNKRSLVARDQMTRAPVKPTPAHLATVTPDTKGPAPVRFVSDDELLALFPGRSLAMIGPPGRKTLVFLDQLGEQSQR